MTEDDARRAEWIKGLTERATSAVERLAIVLWVETGVSQGEAMRQARTIIENRSA